MCTGGLRIAHMHRHTQTHTHIHIHVQWPTNPLITTPLTHTQTLKSWEIHTRRPTHCHSHSGSYIPFVPVYLIIQILSCIQTLATQVWKQWHICIITYTIMVTHVNTQLHTPACSHALEPWHTHIYTHKHTYVCVYRLPLRYQQKNRLVKNYSHIHTCTYSNTQRPTDPRCLTQISYTHQHRCVYPSTGTHSCLLMYIMQRSRPAPMNTHTHPLAKCKHKQTQREKPDIVYTDTLSHRCLYTILLTTQIHLLDIYILQQVYIKRQTCASAQSSQLWNIQAETLAELPWAGARWGSRGPCEKGGCKCLDCFL